MRELVGVPPHPADGGGEVHADRALSTRNVGKPSAGIDDVNFALDMDLLALIDQRGHDQPDVNVHEMDVCGLERNYTKPCNRKLGKLIRARSRERDSAKRRQLVWDVEKKLAEDVARPIISQGGRPVLVALCQRRRSAAQ